MKSNHLTPAEKWEQLTFADDFVFCRILEKNPDVTKELLELLLDIKIERIEKPAAQKDCKTDYLSRGARFDVYVKDGTGRCFDIEIQTANFSDLAKRARYYQGIMDLDNLQPGEDYKELKDSYVIFLCLNDPIGNELPVYTFRYRADEDNSILMNDGTVNIFFNAEKYDKMKTENLQAFFSFLCRHKTDSELTGKLATLVEGMKRSPQERKNYMMVEELMQIRRKEGFEEGLEEGKLETARNFLAKNFEPVVIAECTGLPLEQILELQTETLSNKVNNR